MPFAHGAQPENSGTHTMDTGIDAFAWTRCAQTAFPAMLDEYVFTRRYKARFSGEMLRETGRICPNSRELYREVSSKREGMLAAFEAT